VIELDERDLCRGTSLDERDGRGDVAFVCDCMELSESVSEQTASEGARKRETDLFLSLRDDDGLFGSLRCLDLHTGVSLRIGEDILEARGTVSMGCMCLRHLLRNIDDFMIFSLLCNGNDEILTVRQLRQEPIEV
jgi:hypothetical protein